MKKLIILFVIIIFNIPIYAQVSAKTEYVPMHFNNRGSQVDWNSARVKPLEIQRTPIPNARDRNITYSFSIAAFVDRKENIRNTEEMESTITLKDKMIEVVLGQNYFSNRIISEFWYQDTIKTYKTVDANNTVITYRRYGQDGKHFEIELPDVVVVLLRE